jgi:hypothetical protein
MAPDGGGVTLDGGDARVALDGENLNVPINMKHVSQWYFFSIIDRCYQTFCNIF